MQLRKTSLFTLSLVLAAACSRTSPDTTIPNPVSTDLPATHSPPDDPAAVAVAAMPPEAEVKAPPASLTNDDEIYGVLKEMNDQAIELAESAMKGIKSQRVRDFASMMLADHSTIREHENETRERLHLKRSGSKLADEIKDNSKQQKDVLKKIEKGDQFDKSYVDIEVDAHRMWIEAVDTKLMPRAQMPELRLELNNFRALLERHYNVGKDIQASYKPVS